MADVITRFKLETTQYDSKLRDAAKGLADYAKQATLAGNEFGKFTQKNIEAAKALGNITPSATNAKDKVKELVSAFNDVAKAYNALTKEQQQSDFGKAMAESLTTLKGRIAEAKAEMNSTDGVMDKLAQKFTLNIDAIKLFNIGLDATKAALGVAKDAFFASEANVDEWGRTLEAGKSLYEGFLTALNTGDIGGYLSRIDSIVQAAREAYNELDRLGTMKTIQAPQMSAQQTENERMRMMIQTGRYIAPVDGRRASMQNGQLLTPEQIRRIEQHLQNGMKSVVSMVGNEVKQTGKAIDAIYNRQAQELGLSLKEFRQGTSSMSEFDKRMAGYQKYQEWRAAHTTIDIQSGRETVARGNPFEQYAKWGTFRVDGNRYNDLVRLIQQRDQQSSQAYSIQSQAFRTMNRAEGITVRGIMGGGGGKGGHTGISDEELQAQIEQKIRDQFEKVILKSNAVAESMKAPDIEEPSQAWSAYTQSMAKDFEEPVSPLQKLNAELKELRENLEKAPDTSTYQLGLQAIADKEKEINQFKGVSKMGDDAKDTSKSFQQAASAIGQVGSALNGIQDPSAKIAGIVAQAVATIAQGFANATTTSSAGGIFAWIASLAAGSAAMLSAIATIHSATGYANGGVVKGYAGGGTISGNSYSGDNIGGIVDGSQFVGLNAGELVLTRAQTASLASQLQDNQGGGSFQPYVSGELIFLGANNHTRASGQGEIVTTGMLRNMGLIH